MEPRKLPDDGSIFGRLYCMNVTNRAVSKHKEPTALSVFLGGGMVALRGNYLLELQSHYCFHLYCKSKQVLQFLYVF